MNVERQISVGTWNVDKGGNNKYYKDHELPLLPRYYPEILKGIEVLKDHGVEIISLIDTHGWHKQISSEQLRYDTGFSFAATVPLEDERFLAGGKDTSITILANPFVESLDIVRLHNRNCPRITAWKGYRDVDIYAVYLDDDREKTRIMQTAALVRERSARNRPTIILGDLNCTSPDDSTEIPLLLLKTFETLPRSYLPNRYISFISRHVLNRTHALTEKIRNHGPIRYLTDEGFTDSSSLDNARTMPTKKMFHIPLINVDRILVSAGVTFGDIGVLTNKEFNVSGHYPRIAILKV
jgi:endonuclease/exonuclease/phosphatase family metal-dependent hydrolase